MSLDTYVIDVRQLLVAGKSVGIAPLKVRQIPAFTRAVGPVLAPLLAGDLMSAVAQGGDDLVRAAAIATGESVEWLGELLPDEFLTLLANVIEVNADFFVQRVLPTLNAAAEKTQAILGATPSLSSAPTDTASPASSTTP